MGIASGKSCGNNQIKQILFSIIPPPPSPLKVILKNIFGPKKPQIKKL